MRKDYFSSDFIKKRKRKERRKEERKKERKKKEEKNTFPSVVLIIKRIPIESLARNIISLIRNPSYKLFIRK